MPKRTMLAFLVVAGLMAVVAALPWVLPDALSYAGLLIGPFVIGAALLVLLAVVLARSCFERRARRS